MDTNRTPLQKLREKRGLTSTEVAEAIGLSQGHYSRVERGIGTTPDTAARLADFFGRRSIGEMQILFPERYGYRPPRRTKARAS